MVGGDHREPWWGPDGRTSALGQRHSNAMAIVAETGGGVRRNPETGAVEYGDGNDARRAAFAYGFGQGIVTPEPEASRPAEPSSEHYGPVTMVQDAAAAIHYRLERAASGDKASEIFLSAFLAQEQGDEAGFVAGLEEAARLGDAEAMLEAGRAHAMQGNAQLARFWVETALQAGLSQAYSLLVQLGEAAGDEAAEREWSQRGAEAGDGWSMGNHAYFLLMDARQGIDANSPKSVVNSLLDQCLHYAVRAAHLGHVTAMYSAGLASAIMDDRHGALRWLEAADENGHPNARGIIERFGLE